MDTNSVFFEKDHLNSPSPQKSHHQNCQEYESTLLSVYTIDRVVPAWLCRVTLSKYPTTTQKVKQETGCDFLCVLDKLPVFYQTKALTKKTSHKKTTTFSQFQDTTVLVVDGVEQLMMFPKMAGETRQTLDNGRQVFQFLLWTT